MLRMFIKEDLSACDFSSVKHMTTAGEPLNPEVFRQFEKHTGIRIMEGFGQTEMGALSLANMVMAGAMMKALPEVFPPERMEESLRSVVSAKRPEMVDLNRKAITLGLEYEVTE